MSSVLHGGGAKAMSLLDVSGGEASSSSSSSSRAGRPRSNSLSSLGALHDVFRTPGEREEYEQRQREVSVIMQANEARRRTRRASEPAGAGVWSGSVGKVLQRMGLEQLEEESSQRGRREPLSGRVRRLSEGAVLALASGVRRLSHGSTPAGSPSASPAPARRGSSGASASDEASPGSRASPSPSVPNRSRAASGRSHVGPNERGLPLEAGSAEEDMEAALV